MRFAPLLLTVYLHAAVAAAQAQSGTGAIAGTVVDARTGAGLSKVLVLVEDGGPSTQTEEGGRFELRGIAAGPHRLYVSVVGYTLVRREVTVVSGVTADLTIPLSEGTGTYTETVTVAADRFRPAEPAVAAQQVLGSADIQNLRGVLADDPLRAVQVLPGVATGDDLRSEFTVRGSGFTHMNFTVDGFSTPYLLHTVRAIEDSAATGSVAMINSDILEDVTLLNGGYAQRFGNRTGAEVDFRLREGSRERRQVRGAVSGTNASIVFEGPMGGARRGSWIASARQSYIDYILKRVTDDRLQFGFTDAQAKLVYDLTPAQKAELTVLAGRSRLQQARDKVSAEDLFVGRNASVVAIASWRLARRSASVTARSLVATNEFRNETIDGTSLDEGHDTEASGRVDTTIVIGRGAQVEGGAQADWTDEKRWRQRYSSSLARYRVINDYQDTAVRSGAYAQLQWSRGPVTVVPGARADHWSLTGQTTASPWIQAEWKMTPTLALRGGTGIYRQFPDFEQVIGSLATTGVRPEHAAQYDLGFEQRFGESIRWQVTLYDRQEEGMFRRPGADTKLVAGQVVRGSTSAPYEQRLDGYARGVELLVQRKSPNGLAGWVSFSFGRNRYRDVVTGERFWGDLDQRHTVNVYLFYRRSDRVSFSAKLRAGSNMPLPGYYSNQGGTYYVSAHKNEERLPTYARLDLRANRTFNWSHKRLTLFAEVINVLNRDNVRYDPPGVNSRTGVVSGLFESLIPIVPSAGILIEF